MNSSSRGWIIPIGGKIMNSDILARFAALSGGPRARIAIIPTASSEADTGVFYERLFGRLGVSHAKALPLERRSDCDDDDWLQVLGNATGIFITGGNQGRLGTVLGGTPVSDVILRRNLEGVHVAGTSAGAAFLSAQMIAGGQEGPTPHSKMVTLCAGLGLTNRVIIDQHFTQRDRLGRLLAALAYNPSFIGLGVDEDTAAFISPDDLIEVEGSSGVTVVDPSNVTFSSIDSADAHEPVALLGVTVHILVKGATYDLRTRTARATSDLLHRR